MDNEFEEDEVECAVSMEHFKVIIDVLGGNSDGYDVELLYNKYVALMEGTEEELIKAIKTLEINQHYANNRGFN